MPNPAPVLSSRRPQAALRALAILLATLMLAFTPAVATAQTLMQQPQTKEDAQKAADASTTSSTSSDSTDNTTVIVLLVFGAVLIAGAAYWILRDSSDAVMERDRSTPRRPVERDTVGRGAPKAIFTGEGEAGGKTGKRKKRDQGRRQRQARKANRPR